MISAEEISVRLRKNFGAKLAALVASLTANKDVIAFLDGNYKIEIIIQRKSIAIPQPILEKPVAEAPLQLQLVA